MNNTQIFIMSALLGLAIISLNSLNKKDRPDFHETATNKEQPFKVATSFTIIADMTRNVAGNKATVVSITKPGAEIHDYQPTPKDIMRTLDANLILWNGMNLERWYERFLTRTATVPSVIITDGITPLPIKEGSYSGKPNPHAWMSTNNALIYIDNIEKALSKHDPDNAESYKSNASTYKKQIMALQAELKPTLDTIPKDKRYLVTSEGAFSYLAQDLGLKEVYLWPINAEQQGTPDQVRSVIDTVKNNNVPVVFSESTVSNKPAKQVAEETGAHYGGILYVDSLSKEGGKVPTYIDLLKVTTQTIANGFKEALQPEAPEQAKQYP